MDFVGWCERFLIVVKEHMATDPQARMVGVYVEEVIAAALPPEVAAQEDFWFSDARITAHEIVQNFSALDLLQSPNETFMRLSQRGREHLQDALPLWRVLCAPLLENEHATILSAVNRLSITQPVEGVFVYVNVLPDQLLTELDWPEEEASRLAAVVDELTQMGLLWQLGSIGPYYEVHSTYQGAVWELRRGETLQAVLLDGLLAESETTSVELKRELYLDKDNEKAEFVKDILGLATTQASGRRWFIIGFDDKTHTYYAPPGNEIGQNRLEQILQVYTLPQVHIRYEVVDYRGHQIGKLEVLRDRTVVPYRVAKSIGGKKQIHEGGIYVRHGSQTEHPTPAELVALEEEAQRSRTQQITTPTEDEESSF